MGSGDGVNFPAHLISYVLDVSSGKFTYFDYSVSGGGTVVTSLADNGAVTGAIDDFIASLWEIR